MADYCDNKLIIRGDEKSMNELYNFIGSDLQRNFDMETLMPIPKEIEDLESSEKVHQSKTEENNFAENEYNKQLKHLKNIYGYDNSEDWCENNWGCDGFMNFLSVLYTKTEMYATYITHWCSNAEFIRYLGKIFPELYFNLEYNCPEGGYAGYYKIHNGIEEADELSFYTLYFGETDEPDLIGRPQYMFDAPDSEEFDYDHTDEIDIIGGDWITAFSKSKLDRNNVVNWDDVVKFINSKY